MENKFNIINQKLSNFIRKFYLNELIKGTILFLTFGFLYFLIIILLENFLWLSSSIRMLLFILFITIELFFLFKFIGIPVLRLFNLTKRISYNDASLMIGNYFPEVSDELINLLQLHSFDNKSDLLLASLNQKINKLSPIPFNLAINFKESFSFLKYLLLPFFLFIIFSLFKNIESSINEKIKFFCILFDLITVHFLFSEVQKILLVLK